MGDISELNSKFQSESEKNQLQLIPELVNIGESGLEVPSTSQFSGR
jgi:ARM-like repeat domain, GUN4-N terminal